MSDALQDDLKRATTSIYELGRLDGLEGALAAATHVRDLVIASNEEDPVTPLNMLIEALRIALEKPSAVTLNRSEPKATTPTTPTSTEDPYKPR